MENPRVNLERPSNDVPAPRDAPEDDDNDTPMLSSQALEALKVFLSEQNREIKSGEDAAEEVALVAEDWRLSQFWYDHSTAETIATEVLTICQNLPSPSVACIACPTLYAYLKKIDPQVPAQLLEYDQRFEQYGSEFTIYDYNQPEDLPLSLKHTFPIVVADPPYLSKECLEKVTETIKFLLRPKESYILLLTGEVQKDRSAELLGLRPCGFRPQHSRKLGNEFRLFTSYDPETRLGGWEE
ncbi:N(6)-adenine-specific DNA methyltransferase 2 [Dorcoceras hygrometricum]|uniref:Protein-lysine N-methyltransferase F511_22185 n=1 Tax=Dorcoceras hygrometricum TaxID=472368 RepID=A0A2Z7BW49_9LAMI|nr:N(6)-adenine-specific DNA methyltransferase 2 [Dorcoceras hygrometricum]